MMKSHSETNELNRIEKRAIEASAVAPIIEAVAQRIGKVDALAILQEVNEKEAFQRGESIRNQLGKTGIPELIEDVATWGIGGVLEMEVIEQTSETYHFNITRCPYYEKYSKLGLTDYGVALSCCRDKPFARGFHPQLKLERSQTIMEGADYCDFRYSLHATK
jgi:L-2-amino-thiazoline-4-carboxylic acid hydrolase